MVLLEGMAFKKAVISMDVGSINELVTNETGLLIQAGNYKEFIDIYLVKNYGWIVK